MRFYVKKTKAEAEIKILYFHILLIIKYLGGIDTLYHDVMTHLSHCIMT